MNKKIFFIVAALAFFIACDEKPKNPVAEYGDALIGAHQKAQNAAETANFDAVKKAIQMYRAENEKYPGTLDEIKNLLNQEIDLSKYDYDSATGAVSLKNK